MIEEKIKIVDEASNPLKKIAQEAQKTGTFFDKLKTHMKFDDKGIKNSLNNVKNGLGGAQQELSKAFPQLSSTVSHLGGVYKSLAGINPLIAAGAIAIGGYTAALKGYFKFTQEYVDAYKGQMQAETGLGLASYNRRGTGNISDLTSSASAIQKKGIVGDEAILGGSKNLMMSGYTKEAKTMQGLLADMAVSMKGFNYTAGDVDAASMAISRALGGQIEGMINYGVVLTSAEKKQYTKMDAEKRSAFLQEKLAKSVGGFNELYAKSSLGIKKNFENALGDLKENVGKYVTSAIGGIYSVFTKHLGFFTNISKVLGPALNMIGESLAAVSDIVLSVGEVIFSAVSAIGGPIMKILSEFGNMIGISGEFSAQFSKIVRVIGTNFKYLANTLTGIIDLVHDGINNLVNMVLFGYNTLFDKIYQMMPAKIQDLMGAMTGDLFSGAGARADKSLAEIEASGMKNGGIGKSIVDGFMAYGQEITDIMTGNTGKEETFNLAEFLKKMLGKIAGDTSSINDTTKELGKNDEEYIQSIKDYIINRNQFYNNTNTDSRSYNVTVEKNKMALFDESGRLGDLLA